MTLSTAWRLVFAAVLLGAVVVSACARAPRRPTPAGELWRLAVCALALYAVGALAAVTGHGDLAGLVYGSGIAVAALAAWLSRGRDHEDPPEGGRPPVDPGQPPDEPDGTPRLDWPQFERAFRDYAARDAAGRSAARRQ